MATAPQFAAVPVAAAGLVPATLDTSLTAPTNVTTIFTATGARGVTDGVTTSGSTTVTSASAAFANGDIGRPISGTNIPSGTTIAAVASATSITISAPASASGTALTFTLAGGLGAKIEEVDVIGVATTVAGDVNVFLYDGATYHLWDQVVVPVITSSTTAAAFRLPRNYSNLILPPGWSVRVTTTVAGDQSILKVLAFGGAL